MPIVDVLGGYSKEKPPPIGKVFPGSYEVEFHPGICRVHGHMFYADVMGQAGSKNADVNATAILFREAPELKKALERVARTASGLQDRRDAALLRSGVMAILEECEAALSKVGKL